MKTDIIDIYQEILDPHGIHTLLLNPPFSYIEKADYGFRNQIFENYDYTSFLSLMEEVNDDFPVLVYQDDFLVEYCLIQFPKRLSQKYNATHFLIGPVMFQSLTSIDVQAILNKQNLPKTLHNDFMEFYNHVPHLPTRDFWIALISPLINALFDGKAKTQYYEFNETFMDEYDLKDSQFSFEMVEERYKAENQLLQAVQTGNLDKTIEAHQKFQQFKLTPRSTDSLRSHKNHIFILNTLLRKTIESAHIHPYYIDRISSEFSIKIENCTSDVQLDTLVLQMLRKYCLLVKNYSTRNYSAIVEKCVQQINFHYAEPLSLEILAKQHSVSTSYLSSLFRKETGSTITAFINETRINHSLFLLNTTTLSIQEISIQCGFSDANYFTRMFKKLKGITPMTYRKNIT